jgi:hypothetical protein
MNKELCRVNIDEQRYQLWLEEPEESWDEQYYEDMQQLSEEE